MNVGNWSFFNSKNNPSGITSSQMHLLDPCNNWSFLSAKDSIMYALVGKRKKTPTFYGQISG